MVQSDEKRDSQRPPDDENMTRQLDAARMAMEKYKEALRELAKHLTPRFLRDVSVPYPG